MSDFEQMMRDLEREARERGPEAVAEAKALGLRYRLGVELLAARLEARMSLEDLAEASGISAEEISMIERAQADPGLDRLARLLAPLGKRLAIHPTPADLEP